MASQAMPVSYNKEDLRGCSFRGPIEGGGERLSRLVLSILAYPDCVAISVQEADTDSSPPSHAAAAAVVQRSFTENDVGPVRRRDSAPEAPPVRWKACQDRRSHSEDPEEEAAGDEEEQQDDEEETDEEEGEYQEEDKEETNNLEDNTIQ